MLNLLRNGVYVQTVNLNGSMIIYEM